MVWKMQINSGFLSLLRIFVCGSCFDAVLCCLDSSVRLVGYKLNWNPMQCDAIISANLTWGELPISNYTCKQIYLERSSFKVYLFASILTDRQFSPRDLRVWSRRQV
jgi:hypothetical protein